MPSKKITADVTLFGPGRGGRSSPPTDGYAPQIRFGDMSTSCVMKCASAALGFAFDTEYRAELILRFPQYEDRFVVDRSHDLLEGSKVVGKAVIRSIS